MKSSQNQLNITPRSIYGALGLWAALDQVFPATPTLKVLEPQGTQRQDQPAQATAFVSLGELSDAT